MAEPTITCPNCRAEIKLTESLAAPLIEATKRDYEQRMAARDADVARRDTALKVREATLARDQASLDEQVAAKLQQERSRIADEELKKARLAMAGDLEQKAREMAELQEVLRQRDAKLLEAQKAQAELIRKQRELDDARREMDLTIERRVQESLSTVRDTARKEAEEGLKLRVSEKEQQIAGMQRQIEELKRKAEQGSQQLQGEVQELELETLLKTRFPLDSIEPVPKGEFGGDVVHRVIGPLGQACGAILWETKRTKNWTDGWLPKLREDQRAAKADLAILITHALPKDVESFAQVDGVWVAHPRVAIPLALTLRQLLVEVAGARKSSEGQQTKTELVYQYLTGPRFRQRVQAIVEAFTTMKEDLDKERKVILKQWAKRDEQLGLVLQATVGMYGDLQGIAGKNLQEVEGLELMQLDTPRESGRGTTDE